jgi:hypothetical protein
MRNIDPNHHLNPNFILGQECYIGESCCDAGADNKTTQRRPLTEYRSTPGFTTRCSVDLQTQRRFGFISGLWLPLETSLLAERRIRIHEHLTEIGHCSSVQACHPNSLCRPCHAQQKTFVSQWFSSLHLLCEFNIQQHQHT